MSETQTTPYRVLARKYRPQNFDELIGQDALVRTLTNAIESGRIAHAFMLTGVRGVGKTTTARIIAKALNYTGPDGKSGPTTGNTDDCQLCQAISQDRHPDVMEMDAASRTGVEDIREILDGVRYAPTEARYKIYIIDEVHMLSKNAFNALLKTLEEPPEHVKFIFATTEIRKVPITVLSRCQRFDLRRVDGETLQTHFKRICEKENVKAEEEALALIARAADGSVRDGLSLLDQAMALSGDITAAQVQDMLGLGDRARSLDLLEKALSGDMPEALSIMDDLYRSGADPVQLLQDLLDFTHILTRLRAVPAAKDMKYNIAPDEVVRASEMAGQLSMPTLGKTWQILLKGIPEVQNAPNPQSAAEMVIIRLAYAADLPDPADLIKRLKDTGGAGGGSSAPSGGGASDVSRETVSASAASSVPAYNPPSPQTGRGGAPLTGQNAAPTASRSRGQALALAQNEDEALEHAKPHLTVVPPAPAPQIPTTLDSLDNIVLFLEAHQEMVLASHVAQYVHPVKVKKNHLGIRIQEAAPQRLSNDLKSRLEHLTGESWALIVSNSGGEATIAERRKAVREKEFADALAHPQVRDILQMFPGAELVDVQTIEESEDRS